ncbi:hypothetical protein CHARACLAT_017583 [Characodon lateralis]|uniref:Uncharacterized protein n=1 Tax=Characodon lateralis TaxID=208331 RepID=A0ABU7E1L9_9TELE|nr:hypothetical protein [Characodon lateralis]
MAEAGGSGALILAEAGLENKSIFVLADRRLQLAASMREREDVVVCEGWRVYCRCYNIQSNKTKNTNCGGGEKAGQKHTVHQIPKVSTSVKQIKDSGFIVFRCRSDHVLPVFHLGKRGADLLSRYTTRGL